MDVANAPRITLLDGFTLQFDGTGVQQRVSPLPHNAQKLIAHVCLSRRSSRLAVAGRLWPDVREKQAHGSLRSALWRVHKAAPGLIEVSGDALSLAPGVLVDVDELSTWARRALDRTTDVADLQLSDAGLQGELLPGWYDDWVLLERERLRQLRMHALEAVASRLADTDRHCEALQAAYAAVRAEPLRESAHRTVVRVHLAEGNVAEALRAYDLFRTMAEDELGVSPTERMTSLVEGIPGLRPTGGRRPAPSHEADGTSSPAVARSRSRSRSQSHAQRHTDASWAPPSARSSPVRLVTT